MLRSAKLHDVRMASVQMGLIVIGFVFWQEAGAAAVVTARGGVIFEKRVIEHLQVRKSESKLKLGSHAEEEPALC
jgi:hypothetical protein